MRIYKVGGCIRDKLLGLEVNDNDYVVVGSTPDEMIKNGFKSIGNNFPVFLHPVTHEEYALARCEKKVGLGHNGFELQATPNISLVEDLKRRDITINAIAEDTTGELIDPFNGLADLNSKIIRHISDSFSEDPLRVLRVARFSAKLNFKVAVDTLKLLEMIVQSGELRLVSRERVYMEINKVLFTKYSSNFFKILNDTGALKQILPEFVNFSRNIEELKLLESILNDVKIPKQPDARIAILYYFISRTSSISSIKELLNNVYITNKSKSLANLLITYYIPITQLQKLNNNEILDMINHLDPIRHKERYVQFSELITIFTKYFKQQNTIKNLTILNNIINEFSKINHQKLKQSSGDKFLDNLKNLKINLIQDNLLKHVFFTNTTE